MNLETLLSLDYAKGHPTTQKIAADIQYLDVASAQDVKDGNADSTLNEEEISFFKENGYLIKRGFLSEYRDAFNKTVEHFWHSVPNRALTPEDTAGWIDDPYSHWRPEDHPKVGTLMGTNWKMRSPGESGVGTESFLIDSIANHTKMKQMVSTFLDASVKPVRRVRGIYGVFPTPLDQTGHLGPHGDYMASQLSAMVLAVDVPARCGGFTVWPGSHKTMHLCWDRVHGSTITGERTKLYPAERDRILRDTRPVEFTGKAGDVVFWHPRLIHSAGINYSAQDSNPMVRILIPIDYQRSDETYVDDLEFGPGPKYQWWIDTRNVKEDVSADPSNLWHGGTIG